MKVLFGFDFSWWFSYFTQLFKNLSVTNLFGSSYANG